MARQRYESWSKTKCVRKALEPFIEIHPTLLFLQFSDELLDALRNQLLVSPNCSGGERACPWAPALQMQGGILQRDHHERFVVEHSSPQIYESVLAH